MSGVFGKNIKITIFGQSHSEAIGGIISGVDSGIIIDTEVIKQEMLRRASKGSELDTPRVEKDEVEILSGILDGKTTGDPICGIIRNTNIKSKDYSELKNLMRPSHSDYGYFVKTNGNNDYRGGGQSSGRMTAPMVFCGSIVKQILKEKYGIEISSHILSVGGIYDERFSVNCEEVESINKEFPLINKSLESAMKEEIIKARSEGDSVGGRIECCVLGLKAGVGNPIFDSIESEISALLFATPAVKGIEFGNGFEMSKMRGSQANDSYYYDGDKVKTTSNNNGGILGGISNGMPIVFNVAIKPTPSIFKEQDTINVQEKCNAKLSLKGRHDPCIVIRAVPVIEALTAIAIYDLIKSN